MFTVNAVVQTNYFGGIRAGTGAGAGATPTGLTGIIGAPIGGPAIGPIGRIPGNIHRQQSIKHLTY